MIKTSSMRAWRDSSFAKLIGADELSNAKQFPNLPPLSLPSLSTYILMLAVPHCQPTEAWRSWRAVVYIEIAMRHGCVHDVQTAASVKFGQIFAHVVEQAFASAGKLLVAPLCSRDNKPLLLRMFKDC